MIPRDTIYTFKVHSHDIYSEPKKLIHKKSDFACGPIYGPGNKGKPVQGGPLNSTMTEHILVLASLCSHPCWGLSTL